MPGKTVDLADLEVRGRSKTNKRWRLAEQSSAPVDADLHSTANLANGHQPLAPQHVWAMQRTVGNQRTAQFLAQHRVPPVSTQARPQNHGSQPRAQDRSGGTGGPRRGVGVLGALFSKAFGRRDGRGHGYELSEGSEPPLTQHQGLRSPETTEQRSTLPGPQKPPVSTTPPEPRLVAEGGMAVAPNLRPNENAPGANPRTYWAKTEAELAPFKTTVAEGKLLRPRYIHGPWLKGQLGSHGQVSEPMPLSTKEAEQSRLRTSKQGRNMIVMRPDGELYTADMRTEEERRPGQNVHHSTLAGGGEVAGAGEIETSETGELERVTDQSGHYQPEFVFTHQLLQRLGERGVDLSKTTVELGSKSSLGNLGRDNVLMSSTEALAWEDEVKKARELFSTSGARSDLAKPEQKIRALHTTKDKALGDLRDAYRRLAANNFALPEANLPPPLPEAPGPGTTHQGRTEVRHDVSLDDKPKSPKGDEGDVYLSRGETSATGPGSAEVSSGTDEPRSSVEDRNIAPLLLKRIKQEKEERAAWSRYQEEFDRRRQRQT